MTTHVSAMLDSNYLLDIPLSSQLLLSVYPETHQLGANVSFNPHSIISFAGISVSTTRRAATTGTSQMTRASTEQCSLVARPPTVVLVVSPRIHQVVELYQVVCCQIASLGPVLHSLLGCPNLVVRTWLSNLLGCPIYVVVQSNCSPVSISGAGSIKTDALVNDIDDDFSLLVHCI